MNPQKERAKKLINNNRDRIRGELKSKVFTLPPLPQKQQGKEPTTPNTPDEDTPPLERTSPTKGMNVFVDEGKSFEDFYTLLEKIGEGAHAIVRKAIKNDNKAIVAVKIFRTSDPEIIGTIRKTFQIGRMLLHPNIVAMRELFVNENKGYSHLVMEYVPLPDLQSRLYLFKNNEYLTRQLIRNVIDTVDYMHSVGVCHRDLKPDNILVQMETDSTGKNYTFQRAVIIDLGVSKKFQTAVPGRSGAKLVDMWTATGTQVYCAPEVLKGGGYTKKVDLWAIGVIMYQCLTGCLPFHDETVQGTIELIEQGVYGTNNEIYQSLSNTVKNFLSYLLTMKPAQRYSTRRALQDRWISSHKLQTRDDYQVNFNANSSRIVHDLTQSSSNQKKQQFDYREPVQQFQTQQTCSPDIHIIPLEEKKPFRVRVYSAGFAPNTENPEKQVSPENPEQ